MTDRWLPAAAMTAKCYALGAAALDGAVYAVRAPAPPGARGARRGAASCFAAAWLPAHPVKSCCGPAKVECGFFMLRRPVLCM